MHRERMKKLESDMTKVEMTARSNARYQKLFEQLERDYDAVYKMLERITTSYNALSSGHNIDQNESQKMSRKTFDNQVRELYSKIELLNVFEKKFHITANQIMNQNEFLRSEFTFYQNDLRKALDVYKNKRILLDKVAKQIDECSMRISKIEKVFNNNINQGKMVDAAKNVQKYADEVVQFCCYISEGPSIQTHIYDNIPKLIKTITELYKKNHNSLSTSLEIINFSASLKKIANIYKKLVESYLNLDFESAKSLIKDVLKAIKVLEKQITFEIQTMNIFVQNYSDVDNLIEKTIRNFAELRSEVQNTIDKGFILSSEVRENFSELRNFMKVVSRHRDELVNNVKDTSIPYSTKNSRLRSVVVDIIEASRKINDIKEMIWSANIAASITRNKFLQAETAVNELVANSKRMNIHFSHDQQKRYKFICEKINELSQKIQGENISKDVDLEVKNFVINVAAFYKEVGIDIQLAEIASNLIRELSPRRAIDHDANMILTHAEKMFVENKFVDSLNGVIAFLEERRK